MADLTIVDPFPPLFDASNDLEIHEPHLLSDDHSFLHGGFASDLEFDGVDWDISVDDLLLPEGPTEFYLRDSDPSSSAASGNQSGNLSVSSPESGNSGDCSANAGKGLKVCWSIKRKKEREEGTANSTPNPRSNKFLRTEEISSCVINAGGEEEVKKKARLMRNRESAQLSRQRKKHYVEELEEKVRSMHSTIAELNSKISFFMAENASLKQQLVGNGSTAPKPGVYAAPITPLHFPWFPYPGVAFRSQSSPVPLVPIPKLKTQPPAKAAKLKKSDSKKGERRTKKVASFSLLGLLLFMLIYGRIVPGADHIYEGSRDPIGLGKDRTEFWDDSRSRILRVSGSSSQHSSNHASEGVLDRSKCIGDTCYDRISNKSTHGEPIQLEEKRAFDDHLFSMNFSETLPAFLYVPRNGKHVKINGNLIINSVLASEKAVSQEQSGNPAVRSSGKEDAQTVLAVPGNLDSALALANSGNDLSRYSKSHAISAEHQRALSSESKDAYKDTSLDVPLQKWFREGLAGPMFSSGACTEVFQFEISPAIESNGIIPTASMANATEATSRNTSDNLPSSSSHPAKNMNRRFLYPRAIPLAGTTLNNSEHLGKAPEGGNFSGNTSAHPMVVSILADPREVGNGEVDETILPKKSLSRIFVVVLVDSVKYVTYSCVLPLMSAGPHLVN